MPKGKLTLLLGLAAISTAFSRQERVLQIPNGTKFQCSNCHISSGGGGALTPFGTTVFNEFLDQQGRVKWGAVLAAIDSDGDGASNGTELQDPQGQWKSGQANPGSPALVYNPGNANSKPEGASVEVSGAAFAAGEFGPNPFSSRTGITIRTNEPETMRAELYDINGMHIATLHDGLTPGGDIRLDWDGKSSDGSMAKAGVYYLRIRQKNAVETRKVVYVH